MNTLTCIAEKNWGCLLDFIIDRVVELVVFSVIVAGVIQFFTALYISQQLLKKNRGILGLGYGTQAADIYAQTWYEDQFFDANHTEYLGDGTRFQPKGHIAEAYLVPRKLVEIYTDTISGRKKFRAVKSLKNWMILKMIVFDLVHKYNDNPEIYKRLK